jgi:simple sugar transport system permease protein
MIAGDLDLSVGSTLAAGGITTAVISGYFEIPTWIGIIAGLILGLIVGFLNGIIIVRTNLPSFVVTLGTNFAVLGLVIGTVKVITGTSAVTMTVEQPWKGLLGDLVWNIFEPAIAICAIIVLIVSWILYKSKYGNWIYAIGGDVVSARATGIPVNKVRISMFVASGFASALVGVLQTIMYDGANVNTGSSFVFNSIIAVVVGGVLLTGGYGSSLGVVLGTMTFAIVQQGIYYTGWESDWANLVLGVLLLIAVLTNNTFRRLALSSGKKATQETAKEK